MLALGQIGDADDSEVDAKIRAELLRTVKDARPQVRRYALIALAQIAGRPGEGEKPYDGQQQIRSELQKTMSKGKSGLRPWAGVALGVLGRAQIDNSLNPEPSTVMALRTTCEKEKSPPMVGAYCIGLGLCKDVDSRDVLVEHLMENFKGSDTARGEAAVGLGLMEDRASIEPIKQVVKASEYRPDLLKEAAIGLGLLGDKALVPDLVEMLKNAKGLATQAAISSALGAIGDARSIEPLIEMLDDKQITETARGFAAVALGIVCDKELLPWNAKISTNINYRANTVTLTGESGTGVLEHPVGSPKLTTSERRSRATRPASGVSS